MTNLRGCDPTSSFRSTAPFSHGILSLLLTFPPHRQMLRNRLGEYWRLSFFRSLPAGLDEVIPFVINGGAASFPYVYCTQHGEGGGAALPPSHYA